MVNEVHIFTTFGVDWPEPEFHKGRDAVNGAPEPT